MTELMLYCLTSHYVRNKWTMMKKRNKNSCCLSKKILWRRSRFPASFIELSVTKQPNRLNDHEIWVSRCAVWREIISERCQNACKYIYMFFFSLNPVYKKPCERVHWTHIICYTDRFWDFGLFCFHNMSSLRSLEKRSVWKTCL